MLPVDWPTVDFASTPVGARTAYVVADDLIWASRLDAAARKAGGDSRVLRSLDEMQATLAVANPGYVVIVDLNGRGYDGIDAVRLAASRGATVLAVGQHEDLALRKLALEAGAKRVLSYNKMFSDGADVVRRLMEGQL